MQLAWMIFSRLLHGSHTVCCLFRKLQAGLMRPRPRGRRPATLWWAARWGLSSDDLHGDRHDELMLAQLLFVLSYILILSKEASTLC